LNFTDFGLHPTVNEALEAMGFENPTPVQEKAIPEILKMKDVIACAQTGTGKTAAFLLPIIHKIVSGEGGNLNTIIIAPTRELAQQIDQQLEGFSYFSGISSIAIYGGGSGSVFDQEKTALTTGADIIVATPGRLLSHLNLGYAKLDNVKHLILDEADRMMDMGFNDDIKKIIEYLPKKKQTIMFSATMPPKIRSLAKESMIDPVEISIAISKMAEGVVQEAYLIDDSQKIGLLETLIKGKKDLRSIVIFTSRKVNVNDIKRNLRKLGLDADGIQSDLDQTQREEVLRRFKNQKLKILVGTDIISRGIDIDSIDLVINYDVPGDAEDYVHRVGRTARAQSTGTAWTFINSRDVYNFKKIEQLINMEVPKIPLPEGFSAGPKYDSSSERPKSNNSNKKNNNNRNKKKSFKPKSDQSTTPSGEKKIAYPMKKKPEQE
jgi:superfamily II DNA/RNA helicase